MLLISSPPVSKWGLLDLNILIIKYHYTNIAHIALSWTHVRLMQKIFAAMSNLTFSNTKAYFSTFPQKKERRCGGGLSISESNSERSSPSHFGLVWEILFVKERSHRIPNRPRPLWIGPFGNLEKIAHKLEGIHPEGRSVSSVCSQSLRCQKFFRFLFKIFAPRAVGAGFAAAGLLRTAAGPTSPKGTCQVVSWGAATSPAIPTHSISA